MSTLLDAPIRRVTLLEDRASVSRRGTLQLSAGRHRLTLRGVAPALQDVSLRASVAGGVVADVRIQRRLVALREARPEALAAVEAEMRQLQQSATAAGEQLTRAAHRHRSVTQMIAQGISELPEDVGWGLVNEDGWSDTFEALFARARALRGEAVDHDLDQQEQIDALNAARRRRALLAKRHHDLTADITIDLTVDGDGDHEVTVEYTVPGALWRPQHAARLCADGTLRFSMFAAVWQQTGEDWDNVEIICSTARTSMGTEPPVLVDDLLQARRKSSTVKVQAREVAIQSTGPDAPAAPSDTVDLPGVDDGGEVLNMAAAEPASVPSDGQLNTILLTQFSTDAEVEHVAYPELAEAVFLRSVQRNRGRFPILAGPVELLRDSGPVGRSEILFVAPGAGFELSFGPQDDLRLRREAEVEETLDPIDKRRHYDHTVRLDLSNISGARHTVRLVERLPVSELEEITVALDGEKTTGEPSVDDDGFCTWSAALAPRGHRSISLKWRMSVAPDVDFQP